MEDLPGTLLSRLTEAYRGARDPGRAAGMAAYLRDQFPFLGLPAPLRRGLARTSLAGLPRPDEPALRAVVLACWELPEREFQQFACDYLIRYTPVAGAGFLDVVERLIGSKSWWDTVDPLATRVTGDLVRRHPALAARMDDWSDSEDRWLVRTAILHQLHYGTRTDTARLFGYCTRQAGHPDFFVRKAIGWALRQYAHTDREAVATYLAEHRERLSPLSVREAAKHLT